MTLIQGAGVDWPGPRVTTYSLPSLRKPADPVEELERRARAAGGCSMSGAESLRAARRGTDGLLDAIELLGEPAAVARQPNARGRRQQRACLRRQEIGAQQEHLSLGTLGRWRRQRLTGAQDGLERRLQVLEVGGRAFVDDDQVHLEPAGPPIFHGLQQLVNDPDVLDVRDAQQDDRQVARDALRPQTGLGSGSAHDHFRGRPQRRARHR